MNRKATAAVLGAGSLWGVISIFVRNLNAMGLTAIHDPRSCVPWAALQSWCCSWR